MHQVHIKPASPNRNGKVGRSHLTDQLEFQLLEYPTTSPSTRSSPSGRSHYNLNRLHSSLCGLTPYERLREHLVS